MHRHVPNVNISEIDMMNGPKSQKSQKNISDENNSAITEIALRNAIYLSECQSVSQPFQCVIF